MRRVPGNRVPREVRACGSCPRVSARHPCESERGTLSLRRVTRHYRGRPARIAAPPRATTMPRFHTVAPAILALYATPMLVRAQLRLSEAATVSQTIDGTRIIIEYSRPRARGRTPEQI